MTRKHAEISNDGLGKYAVVTGAASGFGREFARSLAADSYNLILFDINNEDLLKVKLDLEKNFNIKVRAIGCDLSKPCNMNLVKSETEKVPVEILINNAGYGLFGFFSHTKWEIEEDMICLHILNMTHLTKFVLKQMLERGSGHIMNVSSVAGFQPGPMMAVYYASKAFILSFTEALSNEVKGTGVTVTAFCPGQTRTNFQATVARLSESHVSSTDKIMADLSTVARYGFRAMMTGKRLAVPGGLNKLIVSTNRFIPRNTSLFIVRKLQERIRSENTGIKLINTESHEYEPQ